MAELEPTAAEILKAQQLYQKALWMDDGFEYMPIAIALAELRFASVLIPKPWPPQADDICTD